jgi:Protein of unknown function (DUF4242)
MAFRRGQPGKDGDEHIRDSLRAGLAVAGELQRVAVRSKEVANNDFPDEIRWIRSYVIAEEGGTLGTVCVYQASDTEAVRRHAVRVGMPADEILERLRPRRNTAIRADLASSSTCCGGNGGADVGSRLMAPSSNQAVEAP